MERKKNSNCLIQKLVLRTILFLLFLVSNCTYQAVAQSIQSKHGKTRILTGEQIPIEVTLNLPTNASFAPLFRDTLSKQIEIAAFTPADTIKEAGNIQIKQTIYLTSFDSGRWEAPSLAWLVNTAGKMDTLRTKAFFVDVQTVPVDTTKAFKPNKENYETPWTFKEFLLEYYPYLIAGFVIILAIIFGIYYYRRRKQNKPLFELRKTIIEPPHIIALRNLDILKEKKLWQQERVKEYHSELSDILRIYIENRFSVSAMEQTTDEILYTIKTRKIINENQTTDLLRNVLTLADLVKFAKEHPLPDENDKSLSLSYLFVNSTKPSEISKPETSTENIKNEKNEQS